MGKIVDKIKAGNVLVSDGAWGTFLMKKGMKPGESPELWCVDRFDDVKDIAQSYVDAGSDMVEANSFGGTCYKLDPYGLVGRVGEINEAAAKASKAAAGDKAWVIASVGPTGKMTVTGDITPEGYYEAFKEQVIALEKGGADAVCIETMMAVDEAVAAIKAAKENTKLEVICTFTFDLTKKGEFRTLMGNTPAAACKAAYEAGADIVGTNCGNGIERMVTIVKNIREELPDTPILVHANAGLPEMVDGNQVFPDTPEIMAEQLPSLIEAGANIVGGCCGTTPAHITAMRKVVDAHNAKNAKN